MTAYIVIFRNETHDPSTMAEYARIAPTAPIDKLEVIASKVNRFEILEGGPAEAVVILRFPTWDDALHWYNSPEYTEARLHRMAGGSFRVAIVEGVEGVS